jgi:hypothetical protein
MDVEALERLKQAPRSISAIEIDFFLFPARVQEERGARPIFPYTLMTVDAQSGFILGTELLHVDPSLESMWGQVPASVVVQLARTGLVPDKVTVRSALLMQLLEPVAEEIGFKLKRSDRLPSLDSAKEAMLERFT